MSSSRVLRAAVLCAAALGALHICCSPSAAAFTGPSFRSVQAHTPEAALLPASQSFAGQSLASEGAHQFGIQAFGIASAVAGAVLSVRAKTRCRAESLVLSPDETYEAVVSVGESRLSQPTKKILRDGIVTGFYIGFGGVLCSTVGGSATSLVPGLQRFLFGAVGFPLSIFLTTIAGGQGFTPNVGVMASAFIRKGTFSSRTFGALQEKFRVLGLAYAGNTIGLLSVALLANLGALPAVPAAIEIAHHKCSLTFLQVLVRGILGGWLIGLAVWTSVAARDVASKFVTIWLCIGTYVMCQYEHCLANIFFVPCAIFAGAPISWSTFIFGNLIPATIGNYIGGAVMLGVSQRMALGSKPKA